MEETNLGLALLQVAVDQGTQQEYLKPHSSFISIFTYFKQTKAKAPTVKFLP